MKNLSKVLMMSIFAIGLAACGVQGPVNTTGQQIVGYNSNGTPIYGNAISGNACITNASQSLSINFVATGAHFNGNSGFYAGQLPNTHPMGGQHGTVQVGGGMQQMQGAVMLQKQSQAGQLQISINPQGQSASGTIQINPQALYQTGIMNFLYSGQFGGQQQQICVTSIGLDVIYSASSGYYGQPSNGYINSALVYLVLNNGQTVPMPVQFY